MRRNSDGFQRKAAGAPRFEPAGERTDARNAALAKQERHTGAGGFVGSSAVEDDVAVAGDLQVAAVEFVGEQVQSAGELDAVALKLERMA